MALAGCAAILAAGVPSGNTATRPVPTPGGPAAPDEPAADGPANLDNLAVSVRPDGGYLTGLKVGFDRTSRTATGEKPAPAN